FYPVASGIGTLQAGFPMGWGEVAYGAVLLVAQVVLLLAIRRGVRDRSPQPAQGEPSARDRGTMGGMADPKKTLTSAEIVDAVPAGWSQDGQTLTVRFATGDFATGLELVDRIGASAEEANHHPDLTLTYPEVTVTLSSHDVGGVTSRDLDLARRTSEHAAALDVAPAVD